MTTVDKELLELVNDMTQKEWLELRKCLSDDKKIMGFLDVIGELKEWTNHKKVQK